MTGVLVYKVESKSQDQARRQSIDPAGPWQALFPILCVTPNLGPDWRKTMTQGLSTGLSVDGRMQLTVLLGLPFSFMIDENESIQR
jgi:hypothetical protein